MNVLDKIKDCLSILDLDVLNTETIKTIKVVRKQDGIYYYIKGTKILHNEYRPAIEYADGKKVWMINGKWHREDGPAIDCPSGLKAWYINGKCHREDGPAVEHASGHKEWWFNGKLHRLDGPAIEYANGNKEWWINNTNLTKEEFDEYPK